MPETTKIRAPLGWLPAGLITWYEPERRPIALATSWMALICGSRARVRAGWPGLLEAQARSWHGNDFVLNVPDEHCLPLIKRFIADGTYCFDVITDLGQEVATGLCVSAPRLMGCSIQIECRNGMMLYEGFEPEVSGDVVLLHRGEILLDPREVPDLCALNPLVPIISQTSFQ